MEFKINPKIYSNMFAVPLSLVDENIRLASGQHFKVLLYFLRNEFSGKRVTVKEIADVLGLESETIEDALIFWRERGFVLRAEEDEAASFEKQPPENKASQTPAEPKKQPKTVADLPISKPTHEQIAARCRECEELRALFAEAQTALGRTIGYDGQSVIVMLYDSYDLPAEVILMLLEYAKSNGKKGYSYIASLGKKWRELDIDSIERAEQYIEQQSGTDLLWRQFRELAGVEKASPTTKQRRFFDGWRTAFGFSAEMIYLAYEISIDNTEKMSLEYMDRVLKNWYEKGVKTPADARAEREKWIQEKRSVPQKNQKTPSGSGASYDLDAFTKRSVGLKYKKNT